MLGGSLIGQHEHSSGVSQSSCFNITITVHLLELAAEDLNGTLDRLSSLISQKLEPIRATIHIYVEPTAKMSDASNTVAMSDHN